MLTVNGEPEKVMAVTGSVESVAKTPEIARQKFNWKGSVFNVPQADHTGMIPLGEIIPVLFLIMTTDSKEERNEIMKVAMMELRDANGTRYYPN